MLEENIAGGGFFSSADVVVAGAGVGVATGDCFFCLGITGDDVASLDLESDLFRFSVHTKY